jgi:hypothetical protein
MFWYTPYQHTEARHIERLENTTGLQGEGATDDPVLEAELNCWIVNV